MANKNGLFALKTLRSGFFLGAKDFEVPNK